MNKERALYLLDKGFNEGEKEIALVHGTSIETIISLLGSDILPSSQKHKYKDYIYFVPVKAAFRGHPFYKKLKKE